MIWKNKITLDAINSFSKNTILEILGIHFTNITEDSLHAIMPVDHRTTQPYGLLHGGASCVLAESLGSTASLMMLEDPETSRVMGIEINANHLRSVKTGVVEAIAKPVKIGRRVHVWNIEIKDGANRLCCVSRLTCMVTSS